MKHNVCFTYVAHLNSHQSHFKCSVIVSGQELYWINSTALGYPSGPEWLSDTEKITNVREGSLFLQRASLGLRDSDKATEVRFLHLVLGVMLLEEITNKCGSFINKLWSTHTVEYYAIKMNHTQPLATRRMALTNMMSVERSQILKVCIDLPGLKN